LAMVLAATECMTRILRPLVAIRQGWRQKRQRKRVGSY
jgi:hypothetical protein